MINIFKYDPRLPKTAGITTYFPAQIESISRHLDAQPYKADEIYKAALFRTVDHEIFDGIFCWFIAKEEIFKSAFITITEATRASFLLYRSGNVIQMT